MSEGDTIWKTAASLRRALRGRQLIAFRGGRARSGRPSQGSTVTDVRARGKHVLVSFDDGSVLHTHLGMHGSWHLYRPGQPWRRPAAAAGAVVEVGGAVAVCFSASVVAVLTDRELERHRTLASLGPDLTGPEPDVAVAVARVRSLPADTPVASALLDQRVASGIGNIYKSEVLFACGVDPFTPVASLPGDAFEALFARAATMLRSNAARPGPRTTSRGGLAVYGRTGRPCVRCGSPVRSTVHGHERRRTYWCPVCQPATGNRAAS